MTQADTTAVPLLDPAVLDKLRSELNEDAGVWKVFVNNFIAQLPHRIQRLRVALTTADPDGTINALLSLKTSSQMVGADRLAALAVDLELAHRRAARHPEPDVALPALAAAHLRGIEQCGDKTTYLLQVYLRP
jgi:HPt (histidine-containing phosphotransfer) domain-containing protein